MSNIDSSFSLTRGPLVSSNAKNISENACKYLDLDSTYRDRNLYPNPNVYVIPLNYPSRNENSASAIDPVSDSIPYTGSSLPVGSNTTQSSVGLFPNQVALDANEPSIDNYYINSVLQLIQFYTNFYTITGYNGTTKVATINGIIGGTVYTGSVGVDTSQSIFTAALPASTIDDFYTGFWVVFTTQASGTGNLGIANAKQISSYVGSNQTITVSSPFANVVTAADQFYITNQLRQYTGSVDTGTVTPTYTSFALAAPASAVNGFYNGMFAVFTNGIDSGQIGLISGYSAANKEVTLSNTLDYVPNNGDQLYIIQWAPPSAGLGYYTRYTQPFFQGNVNTGSVTPTTTVFGLNSSASSANSTYLNAFVYFTSGLNIGQSARVAAYDGTLKKITLATALTFVPQNGDLLDINSYSSDNASTLIYSGNLSSSQNNYYEIELLNVIYPNQLLGNGIGGKLSNSPYIYVQLYNEGNQLANQVMYSNNPNSINALFKVPVNLYFGSTSFYTLKDCKQKQVIQLRPDKDLFINITYGSGETVQFQEQDDFSPNPPNPLLQISCTFAIRKVG